MDTKQIVTAILIKRFKGLILKIGLAAFLLILLVSLAGSIVDQLSKIPVIGGVFNSDSMEEEIIGMFSDIGLIDLEKVQLYLQIERDSYPQNRSEETEIYQIRLSNLSGKNSTFLTEASNSDYVMSETDQFNIGETTYPYRLWWQSVASMDLITDGSGIKEDTDALDIFGDELGPIFEFAFNEFSGNYDYYNQHMTNTYTVVKVYADGVLRSTDRSQINQLKLEPLPYLNAVSTMFSDYRFTYSPTVLREEDWTEIDSFSLLSYEFNQKSSGSYVKVGGRYVRRTESNKVKREGYWDRSDPDNPVYIPTKYRTRYERVTINTVTTVEQKTKSDGYTIAVNVTPNDRFNAFFEGDSLDGRLSSEDKVFMIQTAGLYPDAYEFLYNASPYLDDHVYAVSGGYSGAPAGNYRVTDDETEYVFPIKFDDSVSEKIVRMTSPYGYDTLTMNGVTTNRFHTGLDFGIPTGTPIVSADAGTVRSTGYDARSGYFVTVSHDNGYYSVYVHLSGYLVNVGDEVVRGEVIAISGNTGYSTGPHLHFGVKKISNGDDVDPTPFLPIELMN